MSPLSIPFTIGLALLVPAGISFVIDKIKPGAGDKWAIVLSFLAGVLIILVRVGLVRL